MMRVTAASPSPLAALAALATLTVLPVLSTASSIHAIPIASLDLNADAVVDIADTRVYLTNLAAGNMAYRVDLDFDGDQALTLKDVLLFGRWVNGLWQGPAHPTPVQGIPEDRARFVDYEKRKPARVTLSLEALKQTYPDRSLTAPLQYDSAKVAYLPRADSAFATLKGAGGKAFWNKVLSQGVAAYSPHAFPSYHGALDFIHTEDLPLLFTTDALLHTVYRSQDNILISLEENRLLPSLDAVLALALDHVRRRYPPGGKSGEDAAAVAAYLETARGLLQGTLTETQVAGSGHPFARAVIVDWSQLTPRGHYFRLKKLAGWFRALQWLSRADLALQIGGPGAGTPSQALRMKKASLILWDAVVNSGAYPAWLDIDATLAFLCGPGDGLSVKSMGLLVQSLAIPSVPAFLEAFDEARFDKVVASGDFGLQSLLSEFSTDWKNRARLFSFLPQRFAIDAFTLAELANAFDGGAGAGGTGSVGPALPSSLDIAFVLGDNSALGDHGSPLPGLLAGNRELYDNLGAGAWSGSLYASWLGSLRKLNGAEENAKVAPVFRSRAWRKKMRNTQLASWADLRFTNILYGKASYGAITCSHPQAYVEPYPDFFRAIKDHGRRGTDLFKVRDPQVSAYFSRLSEISGRLEDAAARTATGQSPTDAQTAWLRDCVSSDHQVMPAEYGGSYGFKTYDGWYFDLIYEARPSGPLQELDSSEASFLTIADVHTQPADARDPRHRVVHAATGYVNLVAAVIETPLCPVLFVGPSAAFYEPVTASAEAPLRLDASDWEKRLLTRDSLAVPPAWSGEFRP